jgi:hypothetical protein
MKTTTVGILPQDQMCMRVLDIAKALDFKILATA